MPAPEWLTWYFSHLSLLTTITGILAFVLSSFFSRSSDGFGVQSLGRAATWCALPNGVAFLICSADASFLPKIPDPSSAFLMGGLALVAVALYDVRQLFNKSEKHARP